jgi:hypothetical protein
VKNHHHRAASRHFSGTVAGEKEDFCKGSFTRTSFTFFQFFFTLFLLASFYQKHKKISFLYICFYLLAFSLVRMSNPEVEVRTFKQQGGESLKDAWYRISNSHHRCTKKHSTMILLRNFYVGVGDNTKWVYTSDVVLIQQARVAHQGWHGGLPTGRPSCWRYHDGTGRMRLWRIRRQAHGGLPCSTRIGLSLGLQVVSAPVPSCSPRQAPL